MNTYSHNDETKANFYQSCDECNEFNCDNSICLKENYSWVDKLLELQYNLYSYNEETKVDFHQFGLFTCDLCRHIDNPMYDYAEDIEDGNTDDEDEEESTDFSNSRSSSDYILDFDEED
jgi:hypothetical protein